MHLSTPSCFVPFLLLDAAACLPPLSPSSSSLSPSLSLSPLLSLSLAFVSAGLLLVLEWCQLARLFPDVSAPYVNLAVVNEKKGNVSSVP